MYPNKTLLHQWKGTLSFLHSLSKPSRFYVIAVIAPLWHFLLYWTRIWSAVYIKWGKGMSVPVPGSWDLTETDCEVGWCGCVLFRSNKLLHELGVLNTGCCGIILILGIREYILPKKYPPFSHVVCVCVCACVCTRERGTGLALCVIKWGCLSGRLGLCVHPYVWVLIQRGLFCLEGW